MYEQDVTYPPYPARSFLRSTTTSSHHQYKSSSSSASLTPLSVTFIPEAKSTKEACRDAPNDKCCRACDGPPPEPTTQLRTCPLYCTRRNVICSSAAHTHHQLPSKATDTPHQSQELLTPSLGSSPASSWSSQDTLFDMSSSLRVLPRLPRVLGNSFRPRSFSAIASLRTRDISPPKPPKEEVAALLTRNSPATFLGTTKRLPEYNLAGKVVLVTGAGRGLGLVQAEALLEAGATVYALDWLREPSPKFPQVQKRAETELGTSLHYRRVDVRDVEGLNSVIFKIAQEHGRMDGLIAAAGIQKELPALEYTAEEANEMFAVNITGCLMTAQATAKAMISTSTRGSIVFIASMSGTIANRGLICPAYNASKAGVLQLARNLASEWGEYDIRVNTISPGYILTDMVEELFQRFPERRAEWPQQNMLGRISRPEEYRGAAVFLISDASSFMTGSDLRMDGGHSSW